ncbi:MAG: gliding motility-associated C-terminal domain-containing protein, partial [Bacteroidetes bacterium]|nr:gliding motility-associated C-terminal domain-containing protein [Bacteroidota bacterium]
MKKLIVFLLIQIVTIGFVFPQFINLVPNPSFEEFSQCPTTGMGEIYLATPWNAATAPGTGSSDFYHACSSDIGVISAFQVQNPRTGIGEVCIILMGAFLDNYREYIEVELKDSLKINKKYCVKFYTSLSNYASYAIGNIGMFFSQTKVIQPNYSAPISHLPQIKNTNGIIKDTVNWAKISGAYTALGGEKYIVIGNFDSLINTNYLSNGGTGNSHYFIDDVSVCDCEDLKPKFNKDTTLCFGQQLLLKANIPKEADSVNYTWQDSSKNSTFLVTQPGTYWVSAYIEDYKITVCDSITVNYADCTSPTLWIPNSFTPNGDGLNDKFEYANAENYIIKTYIYNRWGQMVFEGENTNFWDGTFNGKAVQLGVYAYKIEAMDRIGKIQK